MAVMRPHCRQRVTGIDFSHGMLEVARQRSPMPPALRCGICARRRAVFAVHRRV